MEMYIIIYNKPLFTFSSFSYGRKSKKKKKRKKEQLPRTWSVWLRITQMLRIFQTFLLLLSSVNVHTVSY